MGRLKRDELVCNSEHFFLPQETQKPSSELWWDLA